MREYIITRGRMYTNASDAFSLPLALRQAIATRQEPLSTQALLTLRILHFIRLSQRGVFARCSVQKCLFARWRRAQPYTMYSVGYILTENWRKLAGLKLVGRSVVPGAEFLPPVKVREVSKFSLIWFFIYIMRKLLKLLHKCVGKCGLKRFSVIYLL